MITLKESFLNLQKNNEKAVIASVIAGDPSPDLCVEIAVALAQSGVDILEIGIPFADATVGGTVIQDATKRALQHDIDIPAVFSIIASIRKQTDIPIYLALYYNPLFAFGEKRFCDQAAQAGACGVLVVDLPFGERSSLYQYASQTFPKIELITSTTPEERRKQIASAAYGFLGFIPRIRASSKTHDDDSICIQQIKNLSTLPVCVDIGNGTEEAQEAVIDSCDGVIVSTGFTACITENLRQKDIVLRLGAMAAEIRLAIRK